MDIKPQIKTGRQVQRNWKALLFYAGLVIGVGVLGYFGLRMIF